MKKTDGELELGGEEPDGPDAETDPEVHRVDLEAVQDPRKQCYDAYQTTVQGMHEVEVAKYKHHAHHIDHA